MRIWTDVLGLGVQLFGDSFRGNNAGAHGLLSNTGQLNFLVHCPKMRRGRAGKG